MQRFGKRRSSLFIPPNVEPLPPKLPGWQAPAHHNPPSTSSLPAAGRRCLGLSARAQGCASGDQALRLHWSRSSPRTAKTRAALTVLQAEERLDWPGHSASPKKRLGWD